ncbi:MAG: DMT family transporter [Acidimicrobiales bacterium]
MTGLHVLVASVAAVAAGGSFAAGGVLQQRAASVRPEREALSVRLVVDLAHDRTWLTGIGFAFFSYVLESVALAFGPLALVEPLMVCELLFAVPISVRWRGMRLTGREWLGTAAVAIGLGAGLVCASPGAGRSGASGTDWALAIGAAVVVVACMARLGHRARGPVRAPLYASSAGVVLGVQAALLKATTARFEAGAVAGFSSWELWAMTVAALSALVLVQSAYESGPLAATMPMVDALAPSVAIVLGIALFDEHVRGGPFLAGVAVSLAVLLAGIVLLDTSPVVRCLGWAEGKERRELASFELTQKWPASLDPSTPSAAEARVAPAAGSGPDAQGGMASGGNDHQRVRTAFSA